ncbi:lipase 3-like [Eupeodes corollae]|uniref:lipase 3-like n=1 Tax=Eupeodes corollae TaxID=290404 RepID=UPI00248FAB32|nr:lipase 3-like [Eupeodes corollae]XP_055903606.1 lipase 3-like [Eupeodes corollae]
MSRIVFKMGSRLILLCGFVALISESSIFAQEITTKNLVQQHGYPFEEYTVETEDGYLLGLHRIPCTSGQKCPIAFLNHGLLGSSSDWVLLGPRKAIAYLLSDAGYDIWLGNARGNTYSRKHVDYNPVPPIGPFWDYTFHEIGLNDLPAMIDFIRQKTGRNEMHYFGHSLGTSSFFVMSSLKPSYQKYIKSAHMMTPLVYLEDVTKLFLEISSKVIALTNPIPTYLAGSTEFKPNAAITLLAAPALCDSQPVELCSDILFVVDGFDNITVEPAILNQVLATTPAGISTKSFFHYFQLHESNVFQQYDYGLLGNMRRYNSRKPPIYPLEKVKVPVFLYYGGKDRLVHVQDIDRIVQGIGNSRGVYRVEIGTHQYLIYGIGVERTLYDKMLQDVKSIQ